MADNNVPQLDVPQFAGLIRQKFPGAYDHIDNGVLVSKFIEKYPVYKQYLPPVQSAPVEGSEGAPAVATNRSAWAWANTGAGTLIGEHFGVENATQKALLGPDFAQKRSDEEIRRLTQIAHGETPDTGLREYAYGAGERAEHVVESLTSPLSLALFGVGGASRAAQGAYAARATEAAAAARTAELAATGPNAAAAGADFLSAQRAAESAHAAARTVQFVHKGADVGFMAQGGVNEAQLAARAYREKNPALLLSEESLTNLAMVAGGAGGVLEKPLTMHGLSPARTPEIPKPIETPSPTLARPIEKVPELIRATEAQSAQATQPTEVTKTSQPLSSSPTATPPVGAAASAIRAGAQNQISASTNPIAPEVSKQAVAAKKSEPLDPGTIYQVYARQKYGERVDADLAKQVREQTGARDVDELGRWLDQNMNTPPAENKSAVEAPAQPAVPRQGPGSMLYDDMTQLHAKMKQDQPLSVTEAERVNVMLGIKTKGRSLADIRHDVANWLNNENMKAYLEKTKPIGEANRGPGAKAEGTSEAGSAISALTRSLRENKSSFTDPRPIGERLAASAAVQLDAAKADVYEKWQKVANISKGFYDKLTTRAPITDFRQGVKYWQGQIQKSNWEGDQFVRAMKTAHPDVTRREAMSIYAEADGDMAKMKTWSEGMSDKPSLQKKYRDAMNLTDEEKLLATNARLYWDDKLDQAIKLGFLEHGLEDYVYHVVKRPNPVTNKLQAEAFIGKLQSNPSFAKKRFYETIFDLEKAGHLANADLGYLVGAYDKSFNTAAASRTFIKQLHAGETKSGEPLVEVSGSGTALPREAAEKEAYLIRPKSKNGAITEDGRPYVAVDHPALRKWKWATKDENGTPIFLQGDMLVHPDFAGKLKNLLGRSWFRNWGVEVNGVKYRPLNAVLGAGQAFKETMLDMSGFHAVQVALHGLEHTVNLAKLAEINLDDPHQMRFVENGLVIADHDALGQMSEGGGSGSLVRKIPGAGKLAQFTSDFTFHTLIPRLKMTMAIDAFERNKARYPELTEDQLYELTGEQANAAFGGLNYKLLYRNPTAQDMFRMLALAPDFLEARARFVSQAVKPYGKEQFRALVIGAVTMYTVARFANQAVSGDPHWDKPFSLVVPQPDGSQKEWRLRTIQGDIEHLIRDPQNFTFVRLNPIVARPMVEALMGRDQFGRKQGLGALATDTLKHGIPVAFQNWIRNPQDYSLLDSLLQSMGVSNNTYRSPAERLADDLSNTPPRALTGTQLAQWQLEHKLQRGLASGEVDKARVVEEFKQGRLSPHAFDNLMDPEVNKTRLQRMFTSLNTEDALQVWGLASDKEKQQLLPQLRRKWDTVEEKYPPDDAARIHAQMKAAVENMPKQKP